MPINPEISRNAHLCLRISPRRAARAAAFIVLQDGPNAVIVSQQIPRDLGVRVSCDTCGVPGSTCVRHRIYTDQDGRCIPYGAA
jgi:hypothetical protein